VVKMTEGALDRGVPVPRRGDGSGRDVIPVPRSRDERPRNDGRGRAGGDRAGSRRAALKARFNPEDVKGAEDCPSDPVASVASSVSAREKLGYPFSPRIRRPRGILAKLRPEPVREPLPQPRVYAPPRASEGRRRR
jgi:hypothetical protein